MCSLEISLRMTCQYKDLPVIFFSGISATSKQFLKFLTIPGYHTYILVESSFPEGIKTESLQVYEFKATCLKQHGLEVRTYSFEQIKLWLSDVQNYMLLTYSYHVLVLRSNDYHKTVTIGKKN